LRLFLRLDVGEEGKRILALDLRVCFGLLLSVFFFLLLGIGELTLLACVLLSLLHNLALAEA
jgi:hypothetical protein